MIKNSDLKRWFKEKWVDISRKDESGKHPECGRDDADKGAYPKCRPSKKITKDTPRISKSLSKKEKEIAVKIKRRKEKNSENEPAGGNARKPKYTKLSGEIMSNKFISKRAQAIAIDMEDENVENENPDFSGQPDPEENGMIKSNLAVAARNAIMIHNMINEDETVIPEWCQEKIAVASSMIDTVYDYLIYEMGMEIPDLK